MGTRNVTFQIYLFATFLCALVIAGCGKGGGGGLSTGGAGGGSLSSSPSNGIPTLSVSPTSLAIGVKRTATFSAQGGNPPYVFTLTGGSVGSISPTSGVYQASNVAGRATVRVIDSTGVSVDSPVTVSVLMTISPSPVTVLQNGTTAFTAALGFPPYVYSIASGGGSINSSTGVYSAPAAPGSAVVRVTDSIGSIKDSIVTINGPLAISPTSKTLAANNTFTFSASGGVPPYSYSVSSGTGSIVQSTGVYTAPSSAGTATVQVTDSTGQTSSSTVTINAALAISPTTKTLAVNNSATFTASDGVPPYTFSKVGGGGSLTAGGVYTAPNSSGTATVRVTDSIGNTADSAITINAALSISPSSKTVAVNNTFNFSATGGVSPYSYSLTAGTGSVTAAGAYTAPAAPGTSTITVTDSLGNTSIASVTVNAALSISPATKTLSVNNSFTFTASGGVTPYRYSVPSGGGTINSSTGAYTAPSTAGSATVRVTDALGNTSDSSVTINGPLAISPTSKTVATNTIHTFSATGGVTPYSFSVQTGVGTIDSSTGDYTAPASAGSATIRVTDGLGNTSDSSVTVVTGVVISPASLTLAVNDVSTFSATGGVSPYSYAVSGGLSVHPTSGVYTAPATSGSATVTVTDAIGSMSSASITINDALTISPATKTLAVNNAFTFSATGGVSPYSYDITSGSGSINATTGAYTAPASSGAATVEVTDSLGHKSSAAVTINPALAISPSDVTIAVNNTTSFSASGGVAPYTFSKVSGGGSVLDATAGTFKASNSSGSVVIRVTDSLGNTSDANVTVNAALAISPSTKTLAVNNTTTFSASGGVGPYSYATDLGVVNAGTGFFTAPSSAGTATVTVSDSLGNTSSATVTINAALAISPSTKSLAVNNEFAFSAAGGVSPYSYTMVSGGGAIDLSSGSYTAPATSGTATVKVTDAYGNTSSAAITINPALTITPSSYTMAVNNVITFSGSGGVAPYSYSVVTGGGTINATGSYTAPNSSGSATVRVTDSFGNTADATVTINAALAISPTTYALAVGNSKTFTASGGVSPLIFSVTGGGSINSTSGVYTAGASSGTDTVTVTDAIGNTSSATVTVNPALAISPTTKVANISQSYTFTASGGVTPYSFSVPTGSGTVNSTTGVYTAPSSTGTETVRVTDAIGNTSNATITVVWPTKVVAGAKHSCALFSNGGVKCWGYNASGQLGLGDTNTRGAASSTMGDNLPFVSLGTGRTATDIVAGGYFTCALLDDGGVKCWGDNQYGQLGQGNTTNYGSSSNQMGNSLPEINLGTDKTATAIAAGQNHTCAILNDSTLKCWGYNVNGELGVNNTNTLGDQSGEMGDSLTTVNLGSGLSALKIVGGVNHTCAILTGNVMKCWGLNANGQLGQGDSTNVGDKSANSVSGASTINLGSGKTALAISGGTNFSCAMLNSNNSKCWGGNGFGQLGQGNTSTVGTTNGSMNTLSEISLGQTSTAITSGNRHSCAILSDGSLKCWGYNSLGQLGLGDTNNRGSGSNQMGTNLPTVSLGTSRTVLQVAAGGGSDHTCALLDNHTVKCWGNNAEGELGLSDTTNRGDGVGAMGNSLSALSL